MLTLYTLTVTLLDLCFIDSTRLFHNLQGMYFAIRQKSKEGQPCKIHTHCKKWMLIPIRERIQAGGELAKPA